MSDGGRPGRVSLARLQLGALNPVRLRGFSPRRPRPPYCLLYEGDEALSVLHSLSEPQAETLLSLCAAALSLYPAWERQSWVMPDPEAAIRVHGGRFLDLRDLMLRLGGVQHIEGRHSYLHTASGLAFAAHEDRQENVTLVLGGTNSSHSDSQPRTFPAEVRQLRADVLNVLGRVPQLYRAADLITLLLRDELARERHGRTLTLTGHSLGGGLAQYAALMNGVSALTFSPTALGKGVLSLLDGAGRLSDPEAAAGQIVSYSLERDPIPSIGTTWWQSCVVGRHLRLPLAADVSPARYATSHGQMYPHLVSHLRHNWPDLPDAIEHKAQHSGHSEEDAPL